MGSRCPKWVDAIIYKVLGPGEKLYASDLMHRIWMHEPRFRGREEHECLQELRDAVKYAKQGKHIVITTGAARLNDMSLVALTGYKIDEPLKPADYVEDILAEARTPLTSTEIARHATERHGLERRVDLVALDIGQWLRSKPVRATGKFRQTPGTKVWSLTEWDNL